MAAKIAGQNGTDIFDVDTHGSGLVTLKDASGAALGSAANPLQMVENMPPHPANGGFYSVTGGLSAVVAVSLAANTPLMTMRFNPSSTRQAKIKKIRVGITIATVGTSALVAGLLGLQRFTTATPTGGSARTPNKMDEVNSDATDMLDVRDSNAALTVTSVVFGNVVAQTYVPVVITGSTSFYEWSIEPTEYPIILKPGDGLSLRTQSNMPATQTWMFSYNVYWAEE
jgi:hypothetical protein